MIITIGIYNGRIPYFETSLLCNTNNLENAYELLKQYVNDIYPNCSSWAVKDIFYDIMYTAMPDCSVNAKETL